ncbi:hypothetical protein CEN45_17740 [Fischerella thermalis CCMEE 5198]|jgi:hypothetical protein|uniref:hypothetical protein n=1 Tax=Fischerella thermalis TaxID=372787 RepID=UPI000C7F9D54|nr:hypothetical protein [Fischerella thermalis]PMB20080.1 hypothetical protein CEN45_17740 [Fischerella thermalis CCMEE 5198]
MSQTDFERAKQRLAQAKQDIIWAINVLDDAAKNLSEYKLTPEEVVQLGYQFQRELEEIRKRIEQRRELKTDLESLTSKSPSPNIGASRDISFSSNADSRIIGNVASRITGEIPPFDDPDEDN